jgi:hypothetical protein
MTEIATRRQTPSRRQPVRAIALAGTLAIGIGLGAVLVHAYDQRLDEAFGALEKAAALVDASQAGNVSPRTQRRFDRHRDKARAHIQAAMDHVIAAGTVADSEFDANDESERDQ